ncbi:MAG: hypothetical protein ACTSUE_07255 [Promethearchaeota archaeon]
MPAYDRSSNSRRRTQKDQGVWGKNATFQRQRAIGQSEQEVDASRRHAQQLGTAGIHICIKIVILCFVLAIFGMVIWMVVNHHHTHKDNKSCQPIGNDCLVGKLDNDGHCMQPAATKKHGAKCESKCFLPEADTNSSFKSHKCAKIYDCIDGHETTECLGSIPVGMCEIADDCPALNFTIDIDSGFSSGLQTRCDNGTCVWEVDPYIPYLNTTPTGCSNDHVYRAQCDALLNNTMDIFGCLVTSVLCRGPTDDTYVVDNCRWENKYGIRSGGSWDPDFNLLFP